MRRSRSILRPFLVLERHATRREEKPLARALAKFRAAFRSEGATGHGDVLDRQGADDGNV